MDSAKAATRSTAAAMPATTLHRVHPLVHPLGYRHRQSTTAMSSDAFRSFPSLPAEIRTMIWEYSLPDARVYEVLDSPNAKHKTPAQQGLMFANKHNEPPPAVAAVCRESRYFVLRHYKPLRLGKTTKFVDLSRDMLLLEPYLLVKRLHRTLHFMSQIPLIKDNINRLALGTSYGVYTGICHPVLSWKVSKSNMGKLVSRLADFPKLKALVFIIHQEFQFEFDFGCQPHQYHHFSHNYHYSQQQPLHQPSHLYAHSSPPQHSLHNSPTTMTTTMTPPPTATTTASPLPAMFEPMVPVINGHTATMPPTQHPQVVHQAYRFKFDIEANINYHPHRPHLNELLYYPLDVDEDKDDDWDTGIGDEPEWCDPSPTNDDYRRFRRRFQRAINLSLEMNLVDGKRPESMPALQGASLLWRYTRGRHS